jgi:mannose-6-phosphate isomerase-like protein (cupin superfamily)
MSDHPNTFVPVRVEKPWGHEILWASTDRYVGKILHINAGHLLSLQYHEQKHESIFVLRGRMIFRYRDAQGALVDRPMAAGEAQQVPTGLVHQFEALEDTDVLEASTPHLDDVVRLQDRYGRVS